MTATTTTTKPSTQTPADRLAAERDPLTLQNRATRRRAWLHFLDAACPRHRAIPGVPCWTIPTGTVGGTPAQALCGRRIEGRKFADRAARTRAR